MIVGDVMTYARKINNQVTGGANFSDSTTLHKITVPAGKRWFFIGGRTLRDNASTLKIHIHDTSDEVLIQLLDDAAASTEECYPQGDITIPANLHATGLVKWILDAGEYFKFEYGAAQAGASEITCVVLEVDI